jgi:hypothetical protein
MGGVRSNVSGQELVGTNDIKFTNNLGSFVECDDVPYKELKCNYKDPKLNSTYEEIVDFC